MKKFIGFYFLNSILVFVGFRKRHFRLDSDQSLSSMGSNNSDQFCIHQIRYYRRITGGKVNRISGCGAEY